MAQFSDYLADGLSAMGSIKTSGWGFDYNDAQNQGAIDYALAEQANANEVAMWKMQQEYNTPAAQMQRLKEAGLNPNLAYQLGNTGNASSAPSVHQSQAPNFAAYKQARIAQTNSIIQNIMALTDSAYNLAGKSIDLQQKQMQLNVDKALYNSVGVPTDLPEGVFGYSARFMPNAQKLNLASSLFPFQVRGLDISSALKEYNIKNILPLEKDLLSLQKEGATWENEKRQYNQEMLETMSPLVRQIMTYVEPFLQLIIGGSNSSANWYRLTHPHY